MQNTAKPSQFTIHGGPAGTIVYQAGNRTAELFWEYAVGDVYMVIYESGCRWTAPTVGAMARDEIVALVHELALTLRDRIEIQFKTGSKSKSRATRRSLVIEPPK